MSALDLFIGSEGTLGVITEIELGLIPKSQELFSGIVFFEREEDAWQLADRARRESVKNRASRVTGQVDASALEYFDSYALDILRSAYAQIPQKAQAAIFFEQEIQPGSGKKVVDQWYQLYQGCQALLDQSWFSWSAKEHDEYRVFRHAIPVLVNSILRQYLQTKIGTDFTVPNEHFFDLFGHDLLPLRRSLRGVVAGLDLLPLDLRPLELLIDFVVGQVHQVTQLVIHSRSKRPCGYNFRKQSRKLDSVVVPCRLR